MKKFQRFVSVFPDFEIRFGGHLVSLLFEMYVNYSKITLSAAFRINNFAVWSHIAGTVRTQRMSPFLMIDPLFSNEFSKWSFRYLIAWEKTVIAFNSRPRMSEIFIFIVNFYKTKLHAKAFKYYILIYACINEITMILVYNKKIKKHIWKILLHFFCFRHEASF